MPIYEYACKQCGHEFETLVRASAVANCPSCSSTKLDKKLSLFSSGKSTATAGQPASSQRPSYGHVCGGSCSH